MRNQESRAKLALPDIHKTRPSPKIPQNEKLLAHWVALRGEARFPRRTQFNPMQVTDLLPQLVMLEPDLPDTATIRLFGTGLARRLGMDLSNANLLALYDEERQELLRELLNFLVEHHCVVIGHSEWATPSGHRFTTENLWLPLSDEHGKVIRVLGSLWETNVLLDANETLGGSVNTSQYLTERSYFSF